MSELAQRIVTSHKQAAKRAAEHLARTRNLKLSSAESLELVARVLGVANWQTLLGMANAGQGPRVGDGTLAATVAPVAEELSDAQKLANYYGTEDSWGEHPKYPRKDWEYLVDNGDTGAAYWDHVVGEIEMRQEMFPWERDACFDVKLVTMAGSTVEEGDEGWMLCGERDFFVGETNDELSMWREACGVVQQYIAVSLELASPNRLSEVEWLRLGAQCFAKVA